MEITCDRFVKYWFAAQDAQHCLLVYKWINIRNMEYVFKSAVPTVSR